MAKMHFKYSVMNAGKTSELIQTAYNYEQNGFNVVVLSPAMDTRKENLTTVQSRTGLTHDSYVISGSHDLIQLHRNGVIKNGTVILVDEVQFMSTKTINYIRGLVTGYDCTAICYGLKNNSDGHVFNNTICRLLAVADSIEEVKHICFCGAKATQILKYDRDYHKIIGEGVVDLGAEDKYVSVCYKHWSTHWQEALRHRMKQNND